MKHEIQRGYSLRALAVLWLAGCSGVSMDAALAADEAASAESLRPVAAFADISDETERSAALFSEAFKVIESPRCMNCHPLDRSPTQGNDLHPHMPPIVADEEGHGPPGLPCNSCHQAANVATQLISVQSIPGHEHWGLAPASMGWQGQSSAEICQQLKDRSRNGDRSLAQIHTHMGEDTLVGWAWQPGEGRTPAPGTQREFGDLILAWIETGAACPEQ